jgi:hypothetical protein
MVEQAAADMRDAALAGDRRAYAIAKATLDSLMAEDPPSRGADVHDLGEVRARRGR